MNARNPPSPDPDSRRVRAEAAAWVARLHGPDGNARAEAGLRRWLAEHPAHAAAFELATDAWNDSADFRGQLLSRLPAAQAAARNHWLRPALAISVIGALALAALYYLRSPGERALETPPQGSAASDR